MTTVEASRSAAPPGRPTLREGYSLRDRYEREQGTIFLTGVQALVRLLLDRGRLDRRAGIGTGGIVSGYPGSPVGGLDLELDRHAGSLGALDVVHRHGLNEELAATAVFGSQRVAQIEGARLDGVYGLWFGKAPGVDRAVDAFRHGNFRGMSRHGGVLAVAGDDPRPTSSTLPSNSTLAFVHSFMPVLEPADVHDVLHLGLHGYEISRAAGLAVGMRLVAGVAEASQTIDVDLDGFSPVVPEVVLDGAPYEPDMALNEGGAGNALRERRMVEGGLEVAARYARLNGLNPISRGPDDRIGIVASGKTYVDTVHALASLGASGVRLLKLGLVWPLDVESVLELADGLDEIVVVEEKRPFLEPAIRDVLHAAGSRTRVSGKVDGVTGDRLLPVHGELVPATITAALAGPLARWVEVSPPPSGRPPRSRRSLPLAVATPRSAYFCSGCPHNRSLEVPEGSLVGAGIGCHIMAASMGREQYGRILGYTQMGGEGAQWAGIAPFLDGTHLFQNLGDGTFAHSGSLAVRFAVAEGLDITFKILHNAAVAMTGGQSVTGGMSVPQMANVLHHEGVRRTVVVSEDPGSYRSADLPASVEVRHRDDLVEVERTLAATAGVTVLITDQLCAAEARRKRKRGELETPPVSVFVNERICEGCGDCGERSNCLSVQPIDTEYGRKTTIHQSSCNKDYSCLQGDCPSFMSVRTPPIDRRSTVARRRPPEQDLPTPRRRREGPTSLLMTGIGGTGVVTVNQILATAAHLEGSAVTALDSTGASQKAGPVVSHLRIGTGGLARSPELQPGEADALLAFDLLVAVEPGNLARLRAGEAVAVIADGIVPTGRMVADVAAARPEPSALVEQLRPLVVGDGLHLVPALQIAEALLLDHLLANMVVVGAAHQAGALGLDEASLVAAIELNGVAVEKNLDAFRWGRLWIEAPEVVRAALDEAAAATEPAAVRSVPPVRSATVDAIADPDVRDLVSRRAADLVGYQSAAYAQRYAEVVAEVARIEAGTVTTNELSLAVATQLHRLMAYKDEYEVARLALDPTTLAEVRARHGEDVRIYRHLHPPFLRALGMRRKIVLGQWATPAFRALRAGRRLRGTRLDLFGMARLRRVERALVDQYVAAVRAAAARLTLANASTVLELATAPELIRGYEDIKVRSIERYEAAAEGACAALGIPFASVLPEPATATTRRND